MLSMWCAYCWTVSRPLRAVPISAGDPVAALQVEGPVHLQGYQPEVTVWPCRPMWTFISASWHG
jgi:hypothetical protein